MARVSAGDLPPLPDSALALQTLNVETGAQLLLGGDEHDRLVYVASGDGELGLDGHHPLEPGSAALVLAGERAAVDARSTLALVVATVGPGADRHAPLGPRKVVVSPVDAGAGQATGARSFRVLLGPDTGSTRATLFLGFVPPGRAPWHFHLYDELVWVPDGPGSLHLADTVEQLGPGSAFRLRPREVHIVENTSRDRELVLVGVFTPAGSPSAAFLTPDIAATYRFGP